MRIKVEITVYYDEASTTMTLAQIKESVRSSVEGRVGNGMMASDFDDELIIDEWDVEVES